MVTVWESVSHGLALSVDNEALLWAGTPHPSTPLHPLTGAQGKTGGQEAAGNAGVLRIRRSHPGRGQRNTSNTHFLASGSCSSEDPKGDWSTENWCWEDRRRAQGIQDTGEKATYG